MASEAKRYQVIHNMGSGLLIVKIPLDAVVEQDVNARIMKNEMQDQLTANIAKRGQLESLPYLTEDGNKVRIISGHHRIKSARQAGIKEIYAILDVSGLSRSQEAAKQLAHNAISGFDDQSTLKEIVKMISDVDDMLESYVGKDILAEPMAEFDKLISPAVQFDFRTLVFAFLPHQLQNLELLVKELEKAGPEVVGVAEYEQGKRFVETLSKYQQFQDVRNLGAAISSMIEAANEKMDIAGYDPAGEWTYLTKVFGSNSIPTEAAQVIQQALKKAEKEGVVSKKNRWQLIEFLCADYLGG